MKNRKIAWLLAMLLCVAVVLSGTLLILHADHECSQTACPVCMVLMRSDESFLCAVAMMAATGLCVDICHGFGFDPPENRFVPEWTPVRRKVKLLD